MEPPRAATLLQNIIVQRIFGLPANYWDVYPQKIEGISADDARRVANKYIDLDHLQIVAVGDAAKTRDVLAKFGAVAEYDAEGKLVRAVKN